MARAVTKSIPFDEFISNTSNNMNKLIKKLLPTITKHLELERITKDYETHLNLLLSNYFVAYRNKRNLGLSMGKTHWRKSTPRPMQNKGISYTVLRNIHVALCDLGYTEQVTNHANFEGYALTRTFKPNSKLTRLFRAKKLNEAQLTIDLDSYPVIRLRDFKPKKKHKDDKPKGELLNIEPFRNPQVTAWERELKEINRRMEITNIDIYVTDAEETTIRKQMASKKDEEYNTLQFHRKYFHRSFNNKSWELGGRYYGAIWQSIPSKWRERITIDNCVTQEIDYTSIHFNMIYHDLGATIPEKMCGVGNKFDSSGHFDPYNLQAYNPDWKGEEIAQNRKITKLAMNVMLNASNSWKAYGVMENKKDDFPKIPRGYYSWENFADHIRDCHHEIKHKFYTGEGLRYQFIDSQVATRVMDIMFNKHRELIIPIHDSFICKASKAEQLTETMTKACSERGYKIAMTVASLPKTGDIFKVKKEECTNYFKRLGNYYEVLQNELELDITGWENQAPTIKHKPYKTKKRK
jgi:hypothetical protein